MCCDCKHTDTLTHMSQCHLYVERVRWSTRRPMYSLVIKLETDFFILTDKYEYFQVLKNGVGICYIKIMYSLGKLRNVSEMFSIGKCIKPTFHFSTYVRVVYITCTNQISDT